MFACFRILLITVLHCHTHLENTGFCRKCIKRSKLQQPLDYTEQLHGQTIAFCLVAFIRDRDEYTVYYKCCWRLISSDFFPSPCTFEVKLCQNSLLYFYSRKCINHMVADGLDVAHVPFVSPCLLKLFVLEKILNLNKYIQVPV